MDYNVLSCVADVADCPLQHLSAIVIKNIIIIINIDSGNFLEFLMRAYRVI